MGMVRSVSVIFDTETTFSCSSNKRDFVDLEEEIFTRKLKVVAKCLDISGFGIVEYSDRSESGCIIALRYQEYYVYVLIKDLCFISSQGIFTSEGYKGAFISHCHEDHNSYAELNLKEYKPSWQKAKPVESFYIK